MGNSLCKERRDRAGTNNNNRPVQRVLGSCPQVFSIGNKDTEKWPSHVLETRPPVKDLQPTPGEWKNVTLRPAVPMVTQPMSKSITLPIVPPRKKKSDKLLKSGRPGGFKEVFGNVTRRSSCDSVSSFDRSVLPPYKRRNSSSDLTNDSSQTIDANGSAKKSTLVRKISKVGNRKSDQFFGESLSDLSDEPVAFSTSTPTKSEMLDDIDAFIKSTVVTTNEYNNVPPIANHLPVPADPSELEPIDIEMPSLNKKAEFLMAMLDEYNSDVNQYHNKVPVEEPIIVPKRKHGRHICDDHDRLKKAVAPSEVSFEKHDKNATTVQSNTAEIPAKPQSTNTEMFPKPQSISPEITSPQKPQRDFAKYRNSLEVESKSSDSSETPISPTRPAHQKTTAVLRESLPTPPPRPIRTETKELLKENHLAPPLTTQISTSDTQLNTDHINTCLYNDKMDAVLKKCNSNHSFLTPDLMDQIVNKVYGFKMNWDDHDSVGHSGYDDCSGQVAPNSKLKTRKISVIRKDQITEKPIVEEPERAEPNSQQVSKEGTDVLKSTKKHFVEPEKIESKVSNTHQVSMDETIAKKQAEIEEPKQSNFSIGDVSIKVTKNVSASDSEANGLLPASEEKETKLELDDKIVVPTILSTIPIVTAVQTKPISVVAVKKPADPESLSDSQIPITEQKIISTADLTAVDTESLPDPQSPITEPKIMKKSDTVIEIQQMLNNDAKSEDNKSQDTNILQDIYSQNQSVLKSFHDQFNESNHKYTDNHQSIASEHHEDGNQNDDDSNGPMKSNPFPDHADATVIASTDRRGSIIDHDEWFNEHRDISEDDQPIRRGSAASVSYDTNKLFPFGKREKTFSESSEFFEPTLTCTSDNGTRAGFADSGDSANDHSTLLKYLPSPTNKPTNPL